MSKLWFAVKSFTVKAFQKFGRFVKNRCWLFIGIIFTWVVPILMLNESIALVENVKAHLKLTWLGTIVLIVIILALRKKIYAQIHRLNNGVLRGVLLTLYRTVNYGLFLFVLWGLNLFIAKLYKWWIYSGISMLIGAIFYIIDEYLQSKRNKE